MPEGAVRGRAAAERLAEIAQAESYGEPVGWLRCCRGIDTFTTMLILTELHDCGRFQPPRALNGLGGPRA